MGNFSQAYLKKTIQVWQPHYPDKTLNLEDARVIAENVVGFFEEVIKWKTERKKMELL